MATPVKVTTVDAVPPGTGTVVEAEGIEVALFNVDGKFHAIDNICIHSGGPLGEGELKGKVVTCPWHCWEFDVKSGECVSVPGGKVEVYTVEIQGDDVYLSV